VVSARSAKTPMMYPKYEKFSSVDSSYERPWGCSRWLTGIWTVKSHAVFADSRAEGYYVVTDGSLN